MIIGEVLFFISAAIGSFYLFMSGKLKRAEPGRYLNGAVSLSEIDRILGIFLGLGLAATSLGLILGFIFARQYWEGEWWLNPKITFALLSWFIYLCLVFFRFVSKAFLGRRSAVWAIVGFVAVLVVSIGFDQFVNLPHYLIEQKDEVAQ